MSKKPYTGRDYLMLKIIGGATKAGVEPDRKKEANKTASRGKKMNRADRGNAQQQNTMQLAELKHLKASLAIKDQRIKQLEEQLATAVTKISDLQKAAVPVEKQIVKLLNTEAIEKIAAQDDLVKAIVDAHK